jgi:hypothetical protein
MARGGARPGSGRKKGAANKATAEARKAALASGISPLNHMLSVMRDENADVRGATPWQWPRRHICTREVAVIFGYGDNQLACRDIAEALTPKHPEVRAMYPDRNYECQPVY